MSEITYQCRKCREVLFVQSNITNLADTAENCQLSSQLFLEESKAPPWMKNIIELGLFSKGKLNCPKCNGRLGAFDFVGHLLCGCGQHKLPPIRVHSDRVDNITLNLQLPTMVSPHLISKVVNKPQKLMSTLHGDSSNVHDTDELFHSQNDRNIRGKHENGAGCSTSENDPDNLVKPVTAEGIGVASAITDNDLPLCDQSNGNSLLHDIESINQLGDLQNEEITEKLNEEEPMNLMIDQDPFTCPVCLELFYLPQQCEPCKHVFCDPCLRQLNANTVYGASVKCPLCRDVITNCNTHKDFHDAIKTLFPDEYVSRRKIEKKNKHLLPCLPGMPVPTRRRRNNRNNLNSNMTVLAGVCFVVLATMLGFTVFAVTVGFVSWYLLEIAMELVVDLTAEFSTFFELLRSVIILLCIDGTVKEEYLHSLFNSSSRILMAFAKVVDSASNNKESPGHEEASLLHKANARTLDSVKENMSDRTNELLTKVTQATIANYVVFGGLVTYLLYRLAKYLQTVRAGR